MTNQKKVFVVIPVFNRINLTKKCLKSLSLQNYKNHQTILVDAGSKDGTVPYVRLGYPDHTIIEGKNSWWWARSMYEGVREALKTAQPGDFILSMNNDCFFKSNYLNSIIKTSLNNNRAIVGSLILDAQQPTRVVGAGVKIAWEHGLIYGIAPNISNKIEFYADRGIIKHIDTLPGKGTLIPVEVFKDIGNFNYKRLPHYIADYEFFCRAKRKGFDLIVSSKARLYNYAGETGFSHPPAARLSPKEIYKSLFERKSKQNIIDFTNFILMSAPREHLLRNLNIILTKFLFSIPILHKTRLFLHNLPIYVRQSPLVRKLLLLIHNLPIYWVQSRRRIKKTFR